MRILLVYQYFRPEVGAGIERVFYLAKHLVSAGHKVQVISGVPNYPTGRIYPGYRLRFYHREMYDKKFDVTRAFVYPTKYTSLWKRLVNYLSFTVSSLAIGLFRSDFDVIIASSPPLSSGFVGLLLSFIKRKPLIFEVQDVWPGAAVELGVLKNKIAIKVARETEKAIYKKSKFIVAPTVETTQILLKDNKKFIGKGQLITVSNSVDLDYFDEQEIDPTIVKRYKSDHKFTVLYTGTLGLQQGVSILVDCARKLRNNRKIVFLVVGEGVDRDFVMDAKRKYKLNNLVLLGSVPYKKIPSYISVCDIGLALLKNNRYQDAAIATKVFDYFAGKKPALVSGGEMMRQILTNNNAGFWVPPEDPLSLARKIEEISKLSINKLIQMGDNGRNLVETVFNKKTQVKGWDKILKDLY